MDRHHAVLDAELVKLARGTEQRLIVQQPPRHGKSELGSKYFPAWFLGLNPTKHVILASATDDLAAEFSAAARDVLVEHGEQWFGVRISRNNQAAHHWKVEHRDGVHRWRQGGSMRAVGVGASIFGRGADLLIVDDYHGKVEEALSEAERSRRHRWFHGTMKTRLSPGGVVMIIATVGVSVANTPVVYVPEISPRLYNGSCLTWLFIGGTGTTAPAIGDATIQVVER